YAAAGDRQPACDQREPLQEHRLRSREGFRADRSDRNPDQRALPQSVGAGGVARRVDRLCQGQSRQAQLRLGRQRHAGASRRRAAQARSQDRHHACAVPRHRAGAASRHHVPMAFHPPSPLLAHIQRGTIRALAITTLKRTAVLPEVPTIAESGFPGFEATTWHALVAPAGTPKEVIATLHRATAATVNDPLVRKALTDLGIDVVGGTPEELRAYVKSEIPKWAEVVRASGAKVD